jgi:hypothetical protein
MDSEKTKNRNYAFLGLFALFVDRSSFWIIIVKIIM